MNYLFVFVIRCVKLDDFDTDENLENGSIE